MAPNERPLPEPENALSIELAGMVASGLMSPEEAMILKEDDGEDSEEGDYSDSDDEEDSDDDSDDDSDSDYDSDDDEYDVNDLGGFSADELAGMLSRLEHSKKTQESQRRSWSCKNDMPNFARYHPGHSLYDT